MSLETNVSNLATRVATELKSHKTLINGNAADLSGLATSVKTDLVSALNELQAAIAQSGNASIDDATTSSLSVWSSSKTDAEIDAAVSALIAASPAALDTLNELAAALGNDANFATTINNNIAGKISGPATAVSGNLPSFSGTTGKVAADSGISTASLVRNVGAQSIDGVKTFVQSPSVPDNSFTIAKTTGLQTALDGKAGTALATATAAGIVELATAAEAATGTNDTLAVTPLGLKGVADTKSALVHTHAIADTTGLQAALDGKATASHTHTSANITDFNTAVDARVTAGVPAASETVAGRIELATAVETTAGTDALRAVTPATLKVELDKKASTSHTQAASTITDFATAADARVNTLVPQATEAVIGKARFGTAAEVTAGTLDSVQVSPIRLKTELDKRALTSHTHTASNITDFATSADARVNALVPAATDLVAGKVELATSAETTTGTDTTRATTPAGVKAVADTKAPLTHNHAAGDINSGTLAAARLPAATDLAAGAIELATSGEAIAGVDTVRAITPATLLAVVGNSTTNFVTVFEASLV